MSEYWTVHALLTSQIIGFYSPFVLQVWVQIALLHFCYAIPSLETPISNVRPKEYRFAFECQLTPTESLMWTNVPHTWTSMLLFPGLLGQEAVSAAASRLSHHNKVTNTVVLLLLKVAEDRDTKHWDFCLILWFLRAVWSKRPTQSRALPSHASVEGKC